MRIFAPLLAAGLMFITAASAENVGMIEIRGAISPGTAIYIERAINVAARNNDACLIVQLDTPGGLVSSAQEIVQKFYSSPVPIVVYVSPSGAGATSAGTFITMAADVAVMAPHTTIGSAHPVGPNGEGDTNSIMWTKAENYVATWARTIADKRNRNAEWIERAVRQSVSLTSEEAVKSNVVDFIAADVPDLLKQLNDRKVNGAELKTANATVINIPMAPREKFLLMFLQPGVMFALMLMVIYGIIGELSNPGAILPGVVGGIALILVLYMSAVLPVNTAGLLLIGLALGLFIIDVFAPTHGVLTTGGIIAFFLGALMLFDRSEPAFHLSLWVIIPGTALTALFFIFVVGAGLRAQRLPVRAGGETMLGKVAPAAERIDATSGRVFVEGEWWNAVSETPIETGQPVEIVAIEGLKLKVKPKPAAG